MSWLIMKAMNISIDILNCLNQKMNEFERQQIQSLQYWVWICDRWTFYHLFWNNMTDTAKFSVSWEEYIDNLIEENKRLQKENKELREENEILRRDLDEI